MGSVRQILEATCYSDSYVESGPAKKWGYGKLDIDEAIKYLLTSINGDVNLDGAVTSADITALYSIMLDDSTAHVARADVNADGAITSADITFIYTKLLNQ